MKFECGPKWDTRIINIKPKGKIGILMSGGGDSYILYEILKSYSSIVMKKDFQKINIPILPIFSTEEGIKRIKSLINSLTDWKDINKLIPNKFLSSKKSKKTGISGIFSGSLELVKEGDLIIKQSKLFDKIYIKQKI